MPASIRQEIEERADALGFAALKRAAAEMSDAYRSERAVRLSDEERAVAYLVTRMPATYAAASAVLREARIEGVNNVLDVGAGTGAASVAVRERFPEASITMVERDAALAAAARSWLPDAEVIAGDVTRLALPQRDLVIAAYSLGEFGAAAAQRLWEAARVALIVIEPGTPRGFALVRDLRSNLLAEGAHMVAPCPGGMACPTQAPDWCHFAARVERSSIHRRIKGGELGYEDEKFSYVALARGTAETVKARVIRRPEQRPGLIVLETCTAAGLETRRVTKRDREAFRAARHAGWGQAL